MNINNFDLRSELPFSNENECHKKLVFLNCTVIRMNEKFNSGAYIKTKKGSKCVVFKNLVSWNIKIVL